MNGASPTFKVESGVMAQDGPALPFLLGVPASVDPATPVAVCVHGVTRNADRHFDAFAPLADAARWMLLVPTFGADDYPDYQRLGQCGRGPRADLSLIELLRQIRSRFGLLEQAIHLFGHSGGAQFVHRFAMAHPSRVARYAISAAGWYTLPDATLKYPYGTLGAPFAGDAVALDAFLAIPGIVFVGARDRNDGPTLRRNEALDRQQGASRVDRAQRWQRAVNRRALEAGLDTRLGLRQLDDCAHSFSGLVRRARLHELAWQFLSEPRRIDA